ncbi:MAG: NlpC/P60 family protein [Acidobacteriota bacterium]
MTGPLLALSLAITNVCGGGVCAPAGMDEVPALLAPAPALPQLTGIVAKAMEYLGVRYRLGGSNPDRGIDCANLIRLVFRAERGVDLPWSAAELFRQGVSIATGHLQPGDLVFFKNTYKRGISHVGLYIGQGRFVHAASRKHGVIVSPLSAPYYHSRFAGARRILEPGESVASGG